ncbi:DUF3859 domain-containing protein [Pseudomonas sp. MT3]
MSISRLPAALALTLASAFASSAFAEVRVNGPVEYGVFVTNYKDYQPGERVLTRSQEQLESTTRVPAKLGTKFGLRYQLSGKQEGDAPLTLLYFTPGVVTPDGQRHDKFEVVQKLVVGAPTDVMAYQFTENHEVVQGQWRFMVFQGDRLLAEKTFTVE